MSESKVLISSEEYRELVEAAQRGTALANAVYQNAMVDKFGLTVNATALMTVFKAVFPEDYELWEEDQEDKRRNVGEEAPLE